MVVHGKERNFLLTVGASAEIADLCPGGDLSRIGEVLDGNYNKTLRTVAKIIAAMSRGYENNRKYEEPGYEPNPLTVDEIMSLPTNVLKQLESEALSKFSEDSETSVNVEETKKNNGVTTA